MLRADPRFANAAILREWRSPNPFPVSDQEWEAILAHLVDRLALADEGEPWTLKPGDTIRRVELHRQYGGSGQDGIALPGKPPMS